MGQKVHPLGFRMGVSNQHSSLWYSTPKNYFLFLKEDAFIRDFVSKNLFDTSVSHIEIKRKLNFLIINVEVVKPNLVMGVNNSRLYDLRNKLSNLLVLNFVFREITINVIEVVNPDSNAKLLADFISQQLEKRVAFRRIIKTAIQKAQKSGVKGIKVQISGRLNGAEIARTEWIREGQVPLHTLKANIDYFNCQAQTLYGILGVKVWIYTV
uniref:Small ribosomal subunit protein uS3c n=1 Tax=Euglena viridis TaxID=3040 RepID=A0A0G3VIN3_EUGVI|nr:ribosomal protein S3 [Euglena viridis]